jgi:putative oxidoreductase
MTDHTMPSIGTTMGRPAAAAPPIDLEPMQRLADRLTGMVPPPVARPLLPEPSPAVSAALARSAAQAQEAARRAARRPVIGRLVSACLFLPYSAVALVLRLVIARVFFLDGQAKVEGLRYALDVQGFGFSVIVPMQVKVDAVAAVYAQYSASAMLATIIAYVVAYAEFILPILLVLGLGTRFVALALIGLTVLMQFFVAPQALWTAHVYWASILVVLVSLGAGKISVDQIVRLVARR